MSEAIGPGYPVYPYGIDRIRAPEPPEQKSRQGVLQWQWTGRRPTSTPGSFGLLSNASNGDQEMVRTIVIAILATGIVGLPAVAAEEYWVARDAVSKQCEVVPKKPDGTLVVDLAKKKYASEAEAKKAMDALPDCKKK